MIRQTILIFLTSLLCSITLAAEDAEQILQELTGLEVSLDQDFSAEINGLVGPSTHNTGIGEPCSLTLNYDAANGQLEYTVTGYKSNTSAVRVGNLNYSKYDLILDSLFEDKEGNKALTVAYQIDFFKLHGWIDYLSRDLVSFNSSAIYPVLTCITNGNYSIK